jgi:thymidylate synthase (FAD)
LKAKLIAVTKPVEDMKEYMDDAGDLIAFCARVSNPDNQGNKDTAGKLLNYLKRHKHWSPFEMANCVVEVEAPRDIARQLLRHRSFAFQEFSFRYSEAQEFVVRETRMQDTKNRQNSLDCSDKELKEIWEEKQRMLIRKVNDDYRWALENGIAKECARVILPEGLTMSRLYVNGTIRSWIHYLEVRMEEGVTQKEHVELATLICEQINKVFEVVEIKQ